MLLRVMGFEGSGFLNLVFQNHSNVVHVQNLKLWVMLEGSVGLHLFLGCPFIGDISLEITTNGQNIHVFEKEVEKQPTLVGVGVGAVA